MATLERKFDGEFLWRRIPANSCYLNFGTLFPVPKRPCRLCAAVVLSGALALVAEDKLKLAAPPAAAEPYAEVQPVAESLDLNMYQRIRDEGFNHSHVMEFASSLADGIGARLTGSPNLTKANEWTRDTLRKNRP
jgi:hypothetical protein